jgi:Type II CAAX prenyl endopeptidase Rce1-like
MVSKQQPDQARPQLSRWIAWRNALAITLLGCALFGFLCFVLLGGELPRRMGWYRAAIWLEVSFAIAGVFAFAYIVAWQRRRRSSLAELGWGRPTTWLALVLAVLLGAAYTSGAYFGARQLLPGVNVTQFTWTRLLLAPLGIFLAVTEETLMRGLFMTELERGRVPAWLQIFASGACSAVYHAFQNPTLIGFLPSFVLFSLHAGLYVVGRRSLTPVFLAHSIYHVLGEPYLLMMVFAATRP